MPTLILFRHGKSDWNADYASDHERPLTQRGREAARLMGRLLWQSGQLPDLAVSSTAVRARDTLRHAAQAGHWHCPTRIERALYETTAADTLAWVQALDENPDCLLLTGHEPTWSDLAGRLIGNAAIRFPTGAMLRIDFAAPSWSAVGFGDGEMRWLATPKLLQKVKGRG